MIPIQHRPDVEKLWDGTGYSLRSVARIGERRLPGWIQGVLVKQLPEGKILAAPRGGIQRVWSVLIWDVDIIVISVITRVDTQSFIGRPAKVLSRASHHVQCFPSTPTNMPKVQDPGIAVGWKMTARIGLQAHAKRIAQSQSPNPRARRPRVGSVVVGITGQTITRRRIDPQNLTADGIN